MLLFFLKKIKSGIVKLGNPFFIHSKLVNMRFGKTQREPYQFYLPEDLNKRLLATLQESGFVNFDPNLSDKNATILDSETVTKLNSNLAFYILSKNEVLEEVVQFVEDKIREVLKSPFVVINFRGWLSKPNSEKFGPNNLHLDGFEPGHMKVMIYPNSLNTDNGMLEVEGKLYSDTEPGSCILFHNSDLLHRGIPGKKNDRISLELTLFRSLKENNNIDYYGRPSDRHFVNLKDYYK
jgi:hypothetical protein